jgi:hypothetical protein
MTWTGERRTGGPGDRPFIKVAGLFQHETKGPDQQVTACTSQLTVLPSRSEPIDPGLLKHYFVFDKENDQRISWNSPRENEQLRQLDEWLRKLQKEQFLWEVLTEGEVGIDVTGYASNTASYITDNEVS